MSVLQTKQTAAEIVKKKSAAERNADRQKIRAKLANEVRANFEYQRALDDLAEHDVQAQGYVEYWRERCAPIEAEIAELEAQQTRNASGRKPADESLAERRTALNGELLRLKTAAENQRAAFKQEHERLDRAQIQAALKVPTGKRATEGDLVADGNPRLLAIHALLKHDADAAITRFDLMQSPHLATPRQALDAQLELIEELTTARREAYQNVLDE